MGIHNSDTFRDSKKKWIEDDGESKYRFNFNLNENSIVFDVGGYVGDWSDEIYRRYECTIHVFEPIQQFLDIINKKLSDNKKILVHSIALSDVTGLYPVSVIGDQSTLYVNENKMNIWCMDILKFMNDHKIKEVDLIKINIEGEEYKLLDRMISTDIMKRFKNIFLQFHVIDENSLTNRHRIVNEILKTHKEIYSYPFVWELYSNE